MNECDTMNVAELLRNPNGCIERARDTQRPGMRILFLLAVATAGSAAFGFAVGSFVGWEVALLDSLKMVGVLLFSFLICFPTLYVFASLGGCTLKPLRLMAVGLSAMAVLGCLLAALAPVLWLFAVSTKAVGCIIFFACAFAAIAAYFASRPLRCAHESRLVGSRAGLNVWFAVFFLVALQTVTLMRPMLSPSGTERNPEGKCFFLEHLRVVLFDLRG